MTRGGMVNMLRTRTSLVVVAVAVLIPEVTVTCMGPGDPPAVHLPR